jgi:hypothetical protein
MYPVESPILACPIVSPILVCPVVSPILMCPVVSPILVCPVVSPILVCPVVSPILVTVKKQIPVSVGRPVKARFNCAVGREETTFVKFAGLGGGY